MGYEAKSYTKFKVSETMKVDYFGDDLGWGFYTFTDATIMDAMYYLANNNHFSADENGKRFTNYSMTSIIEKKKYGFFGPNVVIVELTKDGYEQSMIRPADLKQLI